MSAIETFRWSKYTLRPSGGCIFDYRVAKHWTQQDPDHAGKVQPVFWIQQSLYQDSYVLQDRQGIIFFFSAIRFEDGYIHESVVVPGPCVQVHIQFPPLTGELLPDLKRQRETMDALQQGLPWLERVLTQSHVREIFFDSENEPLVAFSVKRLGFTREGTLVRKSLMERIT